MTSIVPSRPVLVLLAALAVVGCAAPSAADPVPVRTADDVPVAYDVQGQGEVALVFVHGWACDREFWREQVPAFTDDFTVVTIDLPGHGASGARRSRWSVTGLALDVLAVVDALDLQRVVVVGHSMGGWVGLAAADRSARVRGVVGVDTLHDAGFRFPPDMVDAIVGRYEADFDGAMAASVGGMVAAGPDSGLARWITGRAVRTDRDAALGLMRAFSEVDPEALFREAGVPIRAVNAAPEMPFAMATAVETNRALADFDAVIMSGVGHFPMLEKPDETNAHLRDMIDDILAGDARRPGS